MKYVVILSALIAFGLLFTGLYFDLNDNPLKHQYYGFGTIMLFIITFPLFLFYRRNKTNVQKYIWRNEEFNKRQKKTDE